jgi:hypothetical protein
MYKLYEFVFKCLFRIYIYKWIEYLKIIFVIILLYNIYERSLGLV